MKTLRDQLTHHSRPSANSASEHNAEQIRRCHALLDSLLDDALNRPDFHGQVTLQLTFRANRLVLFRPMLEQTIVVE